MISNVDEMVVRFEMKLSGGVTRYVRQASDTESASFLVLLPSPRFGDGKACDMVIPTPQSGSDALRAFS
jgi:hypothetical protein